MDASIFIPVYNEEKLIEHNIKKIIKFTNSIKKKIEIIVVDDGSIDNTLNVLKKINGIKVINFENGPSRRENLAQSFKKSKGSVIVYMDADLSVDLIHLKDLIDNVENGNDISIGSRYKGISADRSLLRLLISKIYNRLIQIIFSSKVDDHNCGFKAFRREILDIIDEMGYFTDRGWFWDVEFLIRSQRRGYKIKEFPVKWIKSERKSSFNIFREFRMIPHIVKFRLGLI